MNNINKIIESNSIELTRDLKTNFKGNVTIFAKGCRFIPLPEVKAIVKQEQKELLQELSNEFQPDVRNVTIIYNSVLEEWIEKKLKEIDTEK